MSPTEHDLRAALRSGEGENGDVDVNRIVADGQARQAQRRVRLLSTAAAVVVVAAAGVGGAALWTGNDNGGGGAGGGANLSRNDGLSGQASSNNKAGAPAQAAPSSGSGRSAAGATPSRGAAVACPSTPPRQLLPGGGSPGQFGSDGPMFSAPVASIVVCSYGTSVQSTAGGTPARLVLDGNQATALAASLENAPKTKSGGVCPDIRSTDQHSLAIIGVTASGTAMRTITTTLTEPACNVRVTNGTAVRYNWRPPAGLQKVLTTLTPGTGRGVPIPGHTPTGKNHGSPVR